MQIKGNYSSKHITYQFLRDKFLDTNALKKLGNNNKDST